VIKPTGYDTNVQGYSWPTEILATIKQLGQVFRVVWWRFWVRWLLLHCGATQPQTQTLTIRLTHPRRQTAMAASGQTNLQVSPKFLLLFQRDWMCVCVCVCAGSAYV